MKTFRQIAEASQEDPYFIYNILTGDTKRYLQGPPLHRIARFCKRFGLSLEYFADHTLPVESNFIANTAPDIFTLQTRFRTTGTPKFFHMAAGHVLGSIAPFCGAQLLIHPAQALIPVTSGVKEGITYVLSYDHLRRFHIAHTYRDVEDALGKSLLTDKFLHNLCQKLGDEKYG